jgi:hypothetical protein
LSLFRNRIERQRYGPAARGSGRQGPCFHPRLIRPTRSRGSQLRANTDWTTSVLQCFVAMSWLNLSGFRQTRVNVQPAGKPSGYGVLCTPAKTSEHRLKTSAGIRNPMLYPTELQAPGLSINCWQLIKIFYAIFTIFKTTRKQIRRGRQSSSLSPQSAPLPDCRARSPKGFAANPFFHIGPKAESDGAESDETPRCYFRGKWIRLSQTNPNQILPLIVATNYIAACYNAICQYYNRVRFAETHVFTVLLSPWGEPSLRDATNSEPEFGSKD